MLSRANLHDYQRRGYRHIIETPKCALWLGMGMGKTVTTLTAVVDLLNIRDIERVLIIAPLRVANTVWHAEINNWEHLKHLDYAICTGSQKKRTNALAKEASITVTNKESVTWLCEHLPYWPFDMVVIDESSCFKSHSSKRFKALKKSLKSIHRLVELTGTPSPQSLADLWSQIYLLDEGARLGRNITAFRRRFMEQNPNGFGYSMRPFAENTIYNLLNDVVITMLTTDYLKLPPRLDSVVHVEVPLLAMGHYSELEREFYLELERSGGDVDEFTAANGGVLAGKLLQMCNGALYIDEADGAYSVMHNEKISALKEIVEDNGDENILVAYNYRSDLERLQAAFPQAVVMDKSGEAVAAWQAGKIKMLLAHPASAGHGLNLQAGGALIVWFGLSWSLENYQQFNTRLHRQGQTKPVRIIHIVARGTKRGRTVDLLDAKVMKALGGKADTQSKLMENLKA